MHAGELRVANGAQGPLIALGWRIEGSPAVTATLELQFKRNRRELVLQIVEGQGQRRVDLAVDG